MNQAHTTAEANRRDSLISELLAQAIRNATGNIGVLVRDLQLDTGLVLRQLRILRDEGLDLRIAYLNPTAIEAAEHAGLPSDEFDTTVEQAERWRNQRGLEALIVVVSELDQAKLTSLEDFVLIEPSSLVPLLVGRAKLRLSKVNDVLPLWWDIIGSDELIAFSDLADYFLALDRVDTQDIAKAAATEINMLGLLPDPAFFDDPNENQLRARLKENRSLALRLANFNEDDRAKVDTALAAETDNARRAGLQTQLRMLQKYRRGGELVLSANDAIALLKAKARKPKPKKPKPGTPENGDQPFPPPSSLTALAAQALLRPGTPRTDSDGVDPQDHEDNDDTAKTSLGKAMEALTKELDDLEQTVRPERILVTLPSGTQIDGKVQTDVLALVGRMVNETKYGGLVEVSGSNIAVMVRNFQQSAQIIKPWDSAEITYLIKAFVEIDPQFAPIHQAFEEYDSARRALLPMVRELCVEPFLVAISPVSAPLVSAVVEGYQHLVTAIWSHHKALHESFAEDARALLELVLLIDTVFLDDGQSLAALLTPLHPLLLWHYVEYSSVLTNQRDILEPRDRELVLGELERQGVPLFLPSLGVPQLVSEKATRSLPYTGKFGGLPHFSRAANVSDRSDGLGPIRKLLELFIDMHPSSAEGLRLALLEPPDAGRVLVACCDLAEHRNGKLRGAHVTVLRSSTRVGAELDLTADEERRVQDRFGDHESRRFTFQTVRVARGELAPPGGITPHIYIAFDQTERSQAYAGGERQKVQPLANRRRLAYRLMSQTLDLEPEPGGILADYCKLAKLAVGYDILSYPLIHQEEELRYRMRKGAQVVPWYVVVDGHVDRDLDIGGLRVLTDRERTRAVVAFTKSKDAFRRNLRDVVRRFNTSVNDETLDSILTSLSELLDSGLLALRPGKSGDIVVPHVKGILGLMVAVKHLRDSTPSSYERIVLSLDSEDARRWLHLHDVNDNSRSDLLVIDSADGRFTITIVEVKARQDVTGEYSVVDGIMTGPAIDQMMSTHRVLRRVFHPDSGDLLLTPSRREVIREHIYRELSKASHDKDTRRRWADLSTKLLDGEGVTVNLRCELINVQLGVAATSLDQPREVHMRIGDELVPVSLQHLNEDGVPELEAALTQPASAPEADEVLVSETTPRPSNRLGIPTTRGSDQVDESPQVGQSTPDMSRTNLSAAVVPTTEDKAIIRPRVLIGASSSSYGGERKVFFDPQSPEEKLNNSHISITGATGTGKTQAIKAIVHELLSLGTPALILDFKDDYSGTHYAANEGFTVHDASFGSLPFNPMVPPLDMISGRANPIAHLHELANMLQRVYSLGDQQAYALREAMKETYEISGVGTKPFIPKELQEYLPFEAVKDVLEREKAKTLLGRLSPIFDLGLFSQGDASLTLSDLLGTPTVIRLSQLPGDQVKNAVAEFFLIALHSYLIRLEQPHALRQVLVLDEAWRLVSSPFLTPLLLEGRAFGLGVIVATQFPRQLPKEISGSTATRLFFGQTTAEQVRDIQRTLVGKTGGPEADHIGQLIRGLKPHECVLQNAQYRPWVRVTATPYYAMVSDRSSDE